ncbi:hypothetical protein [Streptomyces celluloflavus]|uniref:hypothetical protein n=1 Tax=Streptomyces celluloflavus TaxID=58344 RepID=UPI00345FA8B8|nr:hypothetical protein OG717_30295 [Streptomyces celluloflavus]
MTAPDAQPKPDEWSTVMSGDSEYITAATFNFEQNGFGDPARRRRAYRLLKSLDLHLLFRQEVNGAADGEQQIRYEAEEALGMRSWLGERSCTAVMADTRVFAPRGEWPSPWTGFKLPPTAVTLQLRDAGPQSTPVIAVAGHAVYNSPLLREIETEMLTGFNDKWVTLPPDGVSRHAVMIGGFDGNSYPHNLVAGDPALPELTDIKDGPHRAHRSRPGSDGVRVMHQGPHETLDTARVVDVGRHLALTRGQQAAVGPTMLAYDTHGPDSRVDWVCSSQQLLPAWEHVEVIDAQAVSDHNIVVGRMRRDHLAELLCDLKITAA